MYIYIRYVCVCVCIHLINLITLGSRQSHSEQPNEPNKNHHTVITCLEFSKCIFLTFHSKLCFDTPCYTLVMNET